MTAGDSHIPADELAALVGISTSELYAALKGTIKPGADGKYPMTAGIKAAFEFMRWERDFMTRDEVAAMLEVSGARVSSMVEQGILEQDAKGRHERAKTIHMAIKWLKLRLGEGKSKAGEQKFEKGELELKILRTAAATAERSSIPRGDVDKAWENLILLTRQSFMGIPNKLAPRMAFLKSEIEVEQVIREAVEESLTNLSRPIDFDAEQFKEE